jgi:hypothetical protein
MHTPHRFERDVRVVRACGLLGWLMSPRSASETRPEHAYKGPVGTRREEFEGGNIPAAKRHSRRALAVCPSGGV